MKDTGPVGEPVGGGTANPTYYAGCETIVA